MLAHRREALESKGSQNPGDLERSTVFPPASDVTGEQPSRDNATEPTVLAPGPWLPGLKLSPLHKAHSATWR